MKRWNGWGDESTTYHLPESAARYLAQLIGDGAPTPDATFVQVCASVPPSRLARHALISTDSAERALHARGQSMSDWIALRAGRVGVYPDGVAYAQSDDDVRAILAYARETGARVIPYGGGTSVVGHINPLPGNAPVVTLDLSRLNHLLDLDTTSHLATFEAGVAGPELETQLRARGFTLGHYPQSWEYSTLGGWIATRSSGQQSYYYGRIENLFAGGHVETPMGALRVYSVHLSHVGPQQRLPQVRALMDAVLGAERAGGPWDGTGSETFMFQDRRPDVPRPAILAGDFNFTPAHPEYPLVCGEMSDRGRLATTMHLADAWAAAGNSEEEVNSFPREGRIDHVFVTHDLAPRVRKAWIDDGTNASDHWPVFVEFDY